MRYRTVSLYDLISLEHKVGKNNIKRILSDFSCPLNSDVEKFMHEKAYDFERIGLSRTYLVYAQLNAHESYLVGIYSLGQSHVEVDKKLSKSLRKRIFGTSYPIGKNIKTILIGQLSKNYANGYNKYITGDILLSLAFSRINEIHKILPSVVTHIDCKDEPKIKRFYERHGFQLLRKTDNDMLIYLAPTSQIIKNVQEVES